MVDKLGAQQIDGDCGMAAGSTVITPGWPMQSQRRVYDAMGYIGLESAEIAGGPYRVMVNNRHGHRIADNPIIKFARRWSLRLPAHSGRGDFKLTGGASSAPGGWDSSV